MLVYYNTLGWLIRPLASSIAAWNGRHPERAREWAQRMTWELPSPIKESVWLHGASVGEARLVTAVKDLFRQRCPERPLVLSATTRSGLQRLPEDVARRFILPFDFRGFPTRVIERVDPRLIVLFETELWPNLIHEAHKANVPVALANARLAPGRMRRYRLLRGLYGPTLRRLSFIGAQSDEDAQRFVSIGARRETLRVTGNLKYDLPVPPIDRVALDRRLGRLEGRPLWVAGSTRPGEERAVLESFGVLRRSFPGLVLVLAPRHLARLDEVRGLIREAGWEPHAWSTLNGSDSVQRDVVLLDTLGELPGVYGAATVAFVGGSLEPFGGHSPLEPAAAGAPVLFGPHTHNFDHPVKVLLNAGGARQVKDATELTAAANAWLSNPELRDTAARAAAAVIRRHAGAMRQTFDALVEIARSGPV